MLDLARIKKARADAGMTQNEVAVYLGLDSSNTISNKESGSRKFTAEEVGKLARLFGVSIDYLYGQVSESDAHRVTLDSEEIRLLQLYRGIGETGKKIVRNTLETLKKENGSGNTI